MSQAFNLSQFANKVNTSGQASLTTAVTGTLPVANGGTGAATLTSNNVLLGNGTSALQVVAPGSNGNILTSNGTTWTSATPAGGGVTSLNGQTGAITNTDYGVIGSYVIAAENNYGASTERLPNVTVAGSSLVRDNATSSTSASRPFNGTTTANQVVSSVVTSLSLSGTWRRMTRSVNSNAGTTSALNLYVRIS
jgi:hypothetical protein